LNYLFETSKAKRLRITLKDENNLLISLPAGLSRKKAMIFIESKKTWIEKQRAKYISDIRFTRSLIQENDFSDREEQKKILIKRAEFLAEKYGFKFNRITIRNQKTRWGSCSSKKNINLNINLARLPQYLMDYVILHELTHLIVRDHNRKFWSRLEKFYPDAAFTRKQFKKINLNYLRSFK
jgi:predicted metal-dependent hydrolase